MTKQKTIDSIIHEWHQRGYIKRNCLAPGDKLKMKNGEVLTVKSLEFRHFVPIERAEYVPKSDILGIIEYDHPTRNNQIKPMNQFYFGGWDKERSAYSVLRDYRGEEKQGHSIAWFVQEDEAKNYADLRNQMLIERDTDSVL